MRISDWSSDGCSSDLSFELFRNARRTGLSGARAVAVAARVRAAADGATAPPLFEDAACRGTMDRAARDRAPARPRRLYDRVAVRRHRLPALHLHDACARNGAFDLCAPPRTGVGVAPAGRAPGAGSRAASGGDRKSVVSGKSVEVRVDLGGRSIIKKKKKQQK